MTRSDLRDIIANSTFEVVNGTFVYAQVRAVAEPEGHFMVTRDRDEITVVTEQARLAALDVIQRNKDDYALIAVNVAVPFYCVGLISAVSAEFAADGLDILVVSTYSKDYVMVKLEALSQARAILVRVGFRDQGTADYAPSGSV